VSPRRAATPGIFAEFTRQFSTASFANTKWSVGPTQLVGFNYYPSIRISCTARAGYTSGDAIAENHSRARSRPRFLTRLEPGSIYLRARVILPFSTKLRGSHA